MAPTWHQYAHDAVAASRAEAVVQEKRRPMVLRIAKLKKETDADHAAQTAALGHKLEPLRVGRYAWLACERNLHDLKTGTARRLSFNEKVAGAAVHF